MQLNDFIGTFLAVQKFYLIVGALFFGGLVTAGSKLFLRFKFKY